MRVASPAGPRWASRPRQWRLSRRLSTPAELALWALLASGALLFNGFGFGWPVVRWALVVHVTAAVILVPVLLIPFWVIHRGLLAATRRRFHAWSGRILEAMLALMLASGA